MDATACLKKALLCLRSKASLPYSPLLGSAPNPHMDKITRHEEINYTFATHDTEK
jgi:hypothetical protein